MAQSLDEAGTKIFIKPNANSIAGWRSKQVSYSFLSICLLDTNSIVLYCRTMWHAAPSRRSILLLVHLLIDAAAGSNFELLRPRRSNSVGPAVRRRRPAEQLLPDTAIDKHLQKPVDQRLLASSKVRTVIMPWVMPWVAQS